MAFQPVPDTAQVRFELHGVAGTPIAGLTWFFSLYVRDTAAPWTQPQLDSLLAYALAWWDTGKGANPPLRNLCTLEWTVHEVVVKDIGAEAGLTAVGVPTNPAGNRTAPNVPPSVPAVVQMGGDPGALPKRGRVFWSGLNEGDLTGDEYGATARSTLAQAFNDFTGNLSNGAQGGFPSWAHVLVSRNSGTVVDPTPPRIAVRRPTALTNTIGPPHTTRRVVGSQRNRREGE